MSKALLKFVRVAPRKARLIAREVKGMNAELALAALEFMPNKAAGIISKVIASAIANGDYEPEEVIITTCRVDKAAVMKRWRPRARGTASRILKPTTHIFVEVATSASVEKDNEAVASKDDKKNKTKQKKSTKAKSEDKKKPKTASADKKPKAESVVKKAKKTDGEGDDLTKLVGVGKAYQEKLNSEGIFTFSDVANMSKEKIDTMEEKHSFKGDFMDTIADAKKLDKKEA